MTLTRVERERITDSRLKIQAVASSLKGVDPKKYRTLKRLRSAYRMRIEIFAARSDPRDPTRPKKYTAEAAVAAETAP